MIAVEKPGSPSEILETLEHHGIKGMKWGVRRERASSGQPHQGLSTKKKVAIGVGVTAAIVGAGVVAYKLHQNGKLPISSLRGGASKGRTFKNLDEAIAAKAAKASKVTVSQIAARNADRETYFKLITSSKKYPVSHEIAKTMVDAAYPKLR